MASYEFHLNQGGNSIENFFVTFILYPELLIYDLLSITQKQLFVCYMSQAYTYKQLE